MRKLLSVVSLFFLFSFQLVFAQVDLRPDRPERYTVVKGDTLWDISSRFLNSPWMWPEIWHVNPQIANPHLIYPGDVIGLVYIDGKPRLTTLERTVKLSPQVRSTPMESAIPAIPLDAINSFLSNNRIVKPEELEAAPYVLEGRDGRLVTGAGDVVYARGEVGDQDVFGLYRATERYVDPQTKEFLGLEARSIGQGKVTAKSGDILTVLLQRSRTNVSQGDRLLEDEDRALSSIFHPSSPKDEIRGQMIAVQDGVSQIGQYAVVVINRGEREGLTPGNVLAIYKKGGVVKDPIKNEMVQLPSERAGLLMVFRTYEKLSYGLILRAERPLALLDEVRNP